MDIEKGVELAKNLVEAWSLWETHFDRQTAFTNLLLPQPLWPCLGESDAEVLSYYRNILQAIQQAEGLRRMHKLLNPSQLEVMLAVLP